MEYNQDEFPSYSVLMSVYEKEKPEYLRRSVDSMMKQTIKPSEFVLVIDGPVPEKLMREIESLKVSYGLKLIPLKENVGLGAALNIGLSNCANEVVARMDSDDIAFPDRMEKELILMDKEKADIVSSAVAEFDTVSHKVKCIRKVPETHNEILQRVKTRNPFNHPSVVYMKSVVESVGGYKDFKYFEDYELFAEMLMSGFVGANVKEPLVYMRAGNAMYERRGGKEYVKCIRKFRSALEEMGICGIKENLTCFVPRIAVALMPNSLRKFVYEKMLRG